MKLHLMSAVFLLMQTLCVWAATGELRSPALNEPEARVILNVNGDIAQQHGSAVREFDLAQLKMLESDSFVVKTRWADDKREYHGPKLSALLNEVGAKGSTLRLSALNDYSVDMDLALIEKYQPILAWREDGQVLSIRNKGPLWLMLPLHKYEELNEFQYNAFMIWQLHSIEVR